MSKKPAIPSVVHYCPNPFESTVSRDKSETTSWEPREPFYSWRQSSSIEASGTS
jgi:hypothetical protein